MELSTEDKQRIYKEVNRIFNESESVDLVHTLMFKSAEYATIYEREQQANGLKSIENPDHHIKVLKEQIQRMEKEYKELEAERSELSDLLAIMHGDGGHHQQKVGTKQAIVDAIELLHKKWVINDQG